MSVRIQFEPIDLSHELTRFHGDAKDMGALVTFVGYVRDFNEEGPVNQLVLEHYPGMTEKRLLDLERKARSQWPLTEVLLVHRTGTLEPGDPIVLVAAGSAHRQAAFNACEFLVDALKTRVPFWKKEVSPSGSRWVEAKTSDDEALSRWDLLNDR